MGNLSFMHQFLEMVSNGKFSQLSEMGMNCYSLILGLSFDLYILKQKPPPEAIVAYTGFLTTFIVAATTTPLIGLGSDAKHAVGFIITLSITLASTSSPVLTRLLNDAKFSRSDIGQLVIGAGIYTDLISMLLICVCLIFHRSDPNKSKIPVRLGGAIAIFGGLILMMYILTKILPPFANWMHSRNPEGKPMKGSDLVLFATAMLLVCSVAPLTFGYSPTMTAFLVGLSFPKKGRLTNILVGKFNQIMRLIVFPIYFCWVGSCAKFENLKHENVNYLFLKFFFLYVMVMIGKVSGAILSGILLGFNWPVAIAIGLFLNVKGHFHIFIATFAVTVSFTFSLLMISFLIVSIFFTIY